MNRFIELLKKYLNKETISYLIFGVLTTVVNWIAFFLLYRDGAGIGKLLANNIAWAISVLFAYITNKLFVFDVKSFAPKILVKEIPSFLGARIFSLLIEDAALWFAGAVGFSINVMKILIAVVVVLLNYVFSKLIIFRKGKEKTEEC